MIGFGNSDMLDITFGSTAVKEIWFGEYKVWPDSVPVVVTYSLINPSRVYSTGTYIQASGSNYAYIIGTVVRYEDGVEVNRSQTTLIPSFVTNPDSNVWSITNNQIHAASRGIVPADEMRAVNVIGYSPEADTSTNEFIVWQDHNIVESSGPGTVYFNIRGLEGTVEFDSSGNLWVNGQQQNAGGSPLGVTSRIMRSATYTSGETNNNVAVESVNESDPYSAYQYTTTGNFWTLQYLDASSNITSITPGNSGNMTGKKLISFMIAPNTGTSDRTGSITSFDADFMPGPSGVEFATPKTINIRQYAYHEYSFTFDETTTSQEPMEITKNTTSFTVTGTAIRDGEQFQLHSGLVSFDSNFIDASVTNVYNSTSTGKFSIPCSCSVNNTQYPRSCVMKVKMGYNVYYFYISQKETATPVDQIVAWSGDYYLAVVSNRGALMVLKDTPIEQDITYTIDDLVWSWSPTDGIVYDLHDTNLTGTITAGTQLTVAGVTYYGYYVNSTTLPGYISRPGIEVDTTNPVGFSVN